MIYQKLNNIIFKIIALAKTLKEAWEIIQKVFDSMFKIKILCI